MYSHEDLVHPSFPKEGKPTDVGSQSMPSYSEMPNMQSQNIKGEGSKAKWDFNRLPFSNPDKNYESNP